MELNNQKQKQLCVNTTPTHKNNLLKFVAAKNGTYKKNQILWYTLKKYFDSSHPITAVAAQLYKNINDKKTFFN